MFVLQRMRDTIRVEPHLFEADQPDKVLTHLIDTKYANKVLPEVGLCVCLFDFLKEGESFIYPGDGSAHIEVEFRLLVFKPFSGEVLEATIVSSNVDGIKLSLGFFEDVQVPKWMLFQPSNFNIVEKQWEWTFKDEDTGDSQQMILEQGSKVLFRVHSVHYTTVKKDANTGRTMATITSNKQMASLPGASDWAGATVDALQQPPVGLTRQRSQSVEVRADEVIPQPMRVFGSMREDGLGPVAWWNQEEEEDDEDEEEAGE